MQNSILIQAKYEKMRKCGSLYIFRSNSIISDEIKFIINGYYLWAGILEPSNYPCPEWQPYDRPDRTYIPFSYSDLDTIQISNGRFLSLKSMKLHKYEFIVHKNFPYETTYFLQRGNCELPDYLELSLIEMELQDIDITAVKNDIINKLNIE